ncbi:MFS transporter [Ammonicoccus fulvus]|uniref:MFS transporter n=1 Tax=Ammonicoccus fulvus TaxID=3138240 RepID=A0ABZ3FLX6_9ACTN
MRRRTEKVSDRQGAVVANSLALCGTVVAMQQTMIIPVLPEMPALLDTTAASASWLVTATLLAGAVSTPLITRAADMYGKKRMILFALTVMIVGSTIGSFGQTLVPVLIARVFQGVGMSLIPVGIAMIRDLLPVEKVPLGVAMMSASMAVGAGVGLPLAGALVEFLDWHAIFWVTAALGVLVMVAMALVLTESTIRSGGSFDLVGAVVISGMLTAIMLVLSKGGQWGWTSTLTLGLGIGAVVLAAVSVPLELRVRQPLVNLRVSTRPAVLLVNLVAVLIGFGMFANMLVTTYLLQLPTETGYGLGLSVLETGLWMVPSSLLFGVMAPVSAAVIRVFGAQVTLLIGALGMAVSYLGRVFLSEDLWLIVLGSVLVAMTTSMAFAAMPTLVMAAVPMTETASANGLNTLLRSVGSSTSSAILAAVTTSTAVVIGGVVTASFGGLMLIFAIAAAGCLAAAILTLPLLRGRGNELLAVETV